MTASPAKKSDLGVRVASAIVMVAIAATALLLGGWAWRLFVLAVALGVLWEWWGLVHKFVAGGLGRFLWLLGGIAYVGIGALLAALLLKDRDGSVVLAIILLGVIGTDIGAYFAGRMIGGPKIAPSISPSKTWAGLFGGVVGATAGFALALRISMDEPVSLWEGGWPNLALNIVFGCAIAVIAQSGDFFESWMKRRAGVKDSGSLIPGHGGLFDRVDGLLAVCFVLGLLSLHSLFISE